MHARAHTHMREGCSKSSKLHQEKRAIAEHFRWGNTLSLIKQAKLIEISVLISVWARPKQS